MTEPIYLLDSNICIYVLGDAAGACAARLGEAIEGEVVTSSIAYAEVMRVIPRGETHAIAAAERLFDAVSPLDFDRNAVAAYIRLPFRRARFDRLIAAHALSRGLTLVTNNEQDFADVPGLKVENWTV